MAEELGAKEMAAVKSKCRCERRQGRKEG